MGNMRFKEGDRVRIKSLDWYNENKDKNGHVKCGTATFDVNMQIYCGSITTIYAIDEIGYDLDVDWGQNVWTDEMIEGLVEELLDKEMEEYQRMCDEIMDIQGIEPIEAEMEQIIHCPEGYIFKDENGNVINARKVVLEKKKKEYPKTYEECCEIMQVARPTIWFDYDDVSSISEEGDKYECHIENTLCAFRKLLICRDAYWKIAGEEMGLGKPWEPDFDNLSTNLEYMKIDKGCFTYSSRVFVFPTEEMRDAFYENFKELIEQCKKLL